jgi:YHS domain-containing protein
MTTDPVCGMQVDEKNSAFKATHQGKTYYFCSKECERQFTENPAKYVESSVGSR